MSDEIKVFPTVEELESICTSVKCSQAECKAVFQSTSNLNMHLIKHHKIELDKLSKKLARYEYHCPIKMCAYHEDSKKYFRKLKYLKQHYLKVHATKKFDCRNCSRKFATETFRNLHVKGCGKLFTCTCGATYNSSEAILTHCKRKGNTHSIMKTISPKMDAGTNETSKSTDNNNQFSLKRSERVIYPKLSNDTMSFPIHYIAAIALSELSTPCNLSKVNDIGIQTDPHLLFYQNSGTKRNGTNMKSESKKRKNSQQTQTVTNKYKKLKISAETQTSGDYLKSKHKHVQNKCMLRKRKKSMETQTKEQIKVIATTFKGVKISREKCTSNYNSTSSDPDVKYVKGEAFMGKIFNESANNIQNDESVKPNAVLMCTHDKTWFWESNKALDKPTTVNCDSTHSKPLDENQLGESSEELGINVKKDTTLLNDYSNLYKSKNGYLSISNQGADQQVFDINRLCNIETQTEMDTFLTDCNDDTSFTLCSTTETQTTDDFDSLLYSNMCTQTSEEVDQLFDFNFVDIETQTAWPDLSDCSELKS